MADETKQDTPPQKPADAVKPFVPVNPHHVRDRIAANKAARAANK